MIGSLVGVTVGLLIGFPLGFCCHKKTLDEKIFDDGFTAGYQYGKDCFYNPQAKG